MSPDRRGLAFLLSIGGLPIACAPENEKIPDDEDATTSTSGGASTTDAVTTSATGFLSTGETSASDTTGPPLPPPPPEAAACIAYYNLLLTCFPNERPYYAAYYAAYCDMALVAGLRADGQLCADAIAAVFTCLSELSCAQFFGDVPHCVEETEMASAACPTTFGA